MRHLFHHFISAVLGAVFVVIVMFLFDQIATVYPIYLPNIFYKEKINYYVDVESEVNKAIEKARNEVVQVNSFIGSDLSSTGSGVIYKLTETHAYVVTNYHVVENSSTVEIETNKGYRVMGSLIGRDNVTDLAVIRIPKGTIDAYLEFSDSTALKIGEYVIAIGSPLGLSGSSTLGIISSLERLVPVDTNNDNEDDWYATVLQTDAAINPGNSGGALINLDGKLVGINSMKIAETNVEGIGFSIPSNIVMRIISELELNGKVERPIFLLGVTIERADINGQLGLKVIDVKRDSLAEQSDLRRNDIITAINGTKVNNLFDLKYYLSQALSGDKLSLLITRGYSDITITVTIP